MAKTGLKYLVAGVPTYTAGSYPSISSGSGFLIGEAISADLEIKYSENPLWASNSRAEAGKCFESGTIKFAVDEISLANQATMFGHVYTAAVTTQGSEAPEKIEKSENDVAPYMCLGYYKTAQKTVNGVTTPYFEATILYKTIFSPPKDSAKTSEGKYNWNTQECEGTIESIPPIVTGTTSDGKAHYQRVVKFATEAEAETYLNTFFGISTSNNDD